MSRRRSASYSSARLSSLSDWSEGEASLSNHHKPQNVLFSLRHQEPGIELQEFPPPYSEGEHQGQTSQNEAPQVASSGRFSNGGHTRWRSQARSAASPPPEPEYPTVDHLPWYAHKYEYVRIPKLALWQCALY
jgi:hypothetical protein